MVRKVEKRILKAIKFGIMVFLIGLSVLLIYSRLNGRGKTLVKFGNPLSSSMKEFVFNSCGSDLPQYKYSIAVPNDWSIYRTSYSTASTYYEVKGKEVLFTVSCTNQGVGGGCEKNNWTKIEIAGNKYNACFYQVNGKWMMSNLNLPTEKETNATISFWSEGLERTKIEKILSSFKRL